MAILPYSKSERDNATIMWVASVVAPIIAPAIFYMMAEQQPFLKRQAALSICAQLATTALVVIGFVLLIVVIGIVPLIVAPLVHLVLCVAGAYQCSQGQEYSPPLIDKMCTMLFRM